MSTTQIRSLYKLIEYRLVALDTDIKFGSDCVPARGHLERARVRARNGCPFAA